MAEGEGPSSGPKTPDVSERATRSIRLRRLRRSYLRYRRDVRRRELLGHLRTRRVVVAAVSAVVLCAVLLPAALVVFVGLQDYNDMRGLGLSGMHHLLAAKADLLPSKDMGATGSDGCAATPTAGATPASPSPGSSATTTPATVPAGSSASAGGLLSQLTIPSVADLTAAHAEFIAAQRDFGSVTERLHGADAVLEIAARIPAGASKMALAATLAHAGDDVAALGAEWTAVALPIAQRLHGAALAGTGPLVTKTDLTAVRRALDDTLRLMDDAQAQVGAIDLRELPICPAQQAEIAGLMGQIPRVRELVQTAQSWIDPAAWLLGVDGPRHFLVQTLDRTELRPTGGFAGEYGVLTIQNGNVASLTLNNVDLLDYGHYSNGWAINNRPPDAYSWWPIANWGLRDANLSADFPTNAALVMSVFAHEGGGNVDGVININPLAIAHVLRVTGPLKVPRYGDIVTADNLEQKIHHYQLDASGLARNHALFPHDTEAFSRKRFVQSVAHLLEDQVRHLPANKLETLAKQTLADVQARDIQVYVKNPRIEQLIAQQHATGTIVTPPGTDSFFVVHTNWSAAKSTPHIQVMQRDNVWLDAHGGATHYLTVTMSNVAGNLPYYGFTTYYDYVRVYVPPGAQLLGADGFDTGVKLCDIKKCPDVPYPGGELICPAGHYDPIARPPTLLGHDKPLPLDVLGGPTETTSDVRGRAMWGGNVVIPIACTATLWLSWYVPNVAAPASAVPAAYRPYTLIVQRQGGTFYGVDITIHPSAQAPAQGKKVLHVRATLATSMAFTLGKRPQPYSA